MLPEVPPCDDSCSSYPVGMPGSAVVQSTGAAVPSRGGPVPLGMRGQSVATQRDRPTVTVRLQFLINQPGDGEFLCPADPAQRRNTSARTA